MEQATGSGDKKHRAAAETRNQIKNIKIENPRSGSAQFAAAELREKTKHPVVKPPAVSRPSQHFFPLAFHGFRPSAALTRRSSDESSGGRK